ncbi:hypothetical protein NST97_01725 [Aeribacillus sp. FSL K6-1305]|uniref:hypothetical protein n=1 Tax=Aeribacillus sp. FSL K6-1305 TaxID=2954569 RepID=UPI0030FDF0C3
MLLFSLPIYRVSPLEWEEEFERNAKKQLEGLYDNEEHYRRALQRIREREYYHYKYNDIVAWLELYLDFTKIKGRTFYGDKQKYRRGTQVKFVNNGKAAGIEVTVPGRDNEDIYKELIDSVMEYKDYAFKNRYIEISSLLKIGRFIDYQAIYQEQLRSR